MIYHHNPVFRWLFSFSNFACAVVLEAFCKWLKKCQSISDCLCLKPNLQALNFVLEHTCLYSIIIMLIFWSVIAHVCECGYWASVCYHGYSYTGLSSLLHQAQSRSEQPWREMGWTDRSKRSEPLCWLMHVDHVLDSGTGKICWHYVLPPYLHPFLSSLVQKRCREGREEHNSDIVQS